MLWVILMGELNKTVHVAMKSMKEGREIGDLWHIILSAFHGSSHLYISAVTVA